MKGNHLVPFGLPWELWLCPAEGGRANGWTFQPLKFLEPFLVGFLERMDGAICDFLQGSQVSSIFLLDRVKHLMKSNEYECHHIQPAKGV